jgi:hypothetical protein
VPRAHVKSATASNADGTSYRKQSASTVVDKARRYFEQLDLDWHTNQSIKNREQDLFSILNVALRLNSVSKHAKGYSSYLSYRPLVWGISVIEMRKHIVLCGTVAYAVVKQRNRKGNRKFKPRPSTYNYRVENFPQTRQGS